VNNKRIDYYALSGELDHLLLSLDNELDGYKDHKSDILPAMVKAQIDIVKKVWDIMEDLTYEDTPDDEVA
jgi:hypothetical protein